LLLEGKPFEVWGGNQLRDFTYVEDAIDALLVAASEDTANGRAYNLGGCEVVSLEQLAKLLVQTNGSGAFELREFPTERKRIDIGDYYADDHLIENELGWRPVTELAQGLSASLAYFREHLPKYL
jgi:nucleoside-diphosphate-sugar epimerase